MCNVLTEQRLPESWNTDSGPKIGMCLATQARVQKGGEVQNGVPEGYYCILGLDQIGSQYTSPSSTSSYVYCVLTCCAIL